MALLLTASQTSKSFCPWLILLLVLLSDLPCSRASQSGDWLINPAPFAAKITVSADGREINLANGLVRRVIRLKPDAATVAFDNFMTGDSLLRSVRAEARLELNGKKLEVGGLLGQPIHNYLSPAWREQLTADPSACRFIRFTTGRTESRFAWQKRHEWLTDDPPWPPPGASLTLFFETPSDFGPATVEVHYEIYDGLPLISKWLIVRNPSARAIRLNSLTVEQMALVEAESVVEGAAAIFRGVQICLPMPRRSRLGAVIARFF